MIFWMLQSLKVEAKFNAKAKTNTDQNKSHRPKYILNATPCLIIYT